jgi:RNA polymerase sigma factor (sigma-70 family)
VQAHHTLFLADPRVKKIIQLKAKQMVGHYGFSKCDRDDLEQEFKLEILKQSVQYDHTKSSVQTFADRVIVHRIADLIEERQAQCRDWRKTISLSERVSGDDDEHLLLEDCLDTEGSFGFCKSPHSPQHEAADQMRDIQRFLERLEPQLRDFCLRLLKQTIAEIARETGEPASTLYDLRRRIRDQYKKFEGNAK